MLLSLPTAPFLIDLLDALRQTTAEQHLLIMVTTLCAATAALLLSSFRVARPVPTLTRGAILASALLLLGALAYPMLLLGAGFGWAGVVLLLAIDELLLIRHHSREQGFIRQFYRPAGEQDSESKA